MYRLVPCILLLASCGHAALAPTKPSQWDLDALPAESTLDYHGGEGAEQVYYGPTIRGTTDGQLIIAYVAPYLILDDLNASSWNVQEHRDIEAVRTTVCRDDEQTDSDSGGNAVVDEAWINREHTTLVVTMRYRCPELETSFEATHVVSLPVKENRHRWRERERDATWLMLDERVTQLREWRENLEAGDSDERKDVLASWRDELARFLVWWEPRFPMHAAIRAAKALEASTSYLELPAEP